MGQQRRQELGGLDALRAAAERHGVATQQQDAEAATRDFHDIQLLRLRSGSSGLPPLNLRSASAPAGSMMVDDSDGGSDMAAAIPRLATASAATVASEAAAADAASPAGRAGHADAAAAARMQPAPADAWQGTSLAAAAAATAPDAFAAQFVDGGGAHSVHIRDEATDMEEAPPLRTNTPTAVARSIPVPVSPMGESTNLKLFGSMLQAF